MKVAKLASCGPLKFWILKNCLVLGSYSFYFSNNWLVLVVWDIQRPVFWGGILRDNRPAP
jgi:hypothetical protein